MKPVYAGVPAGASRETPGAAVLPPAAAPLLPPAAAASCLGAAEALEPEASPALFQPYLGGGASGALEVPATGAGWADGAGSAPMPP